MSLKDAFVNVAQGAATSIANRAVTSVVQGVASGLKGSNPTNDTSSLGAQSRPSPILSYPDDVDTDPMQGHYILFGVRVVKPGKIERPKAVSAVEAGAGGDFAFQAQAVGQQVQGLPPGKASELFEKSAKEAKGKNTSIRLKTASTSQYVKHVALYMPPQVSVSYEAKYADQEIGVLAEAGSDVLRSIFGGEKFSFGKLKGDVLQAVKSKGIDAIDAVAPGAKALIALERGKIMTPRMELMFEGIGRRNFEFSFVMIPKTLNEAEKIREIVHVFKKHMTSDVSTTNFGQQKNVRELGIPDVFDIKYMYRNKENSYLNKISTCSLTGMDVQYGGDRYTAYEPDSSGSPPPQRTSISLKFTELEIMYRNRIEDGF
jgi:hypothetical protein